MLRGILFGSLVGCLALTGCHTPRGAILPYTGNSYTYYSTEQMPKTITIVDTRTNEPFFTQEIPPGRQLTIQFLKDEGDDEVNTPDLMLYQVFDLGTRIGKLRNSMSVPNATCRKIEMDFRTGPEASPAPPEQRFRTDTLSGRPSWWTPEGGPLPENDGQNIYDD
jgi:hypothetical protein